MDNTIYEDDRNLISLTDEEGNELILEVLDSIFYQDIEYLVFLPADEGDEAEEVVILEVALQSDGSEQFLSVDDEAILTAVFNLFMERMQEIQEG